MLPFVVLCDLQTLVLFIYLFGFFVLFVVGFFVCFRTYFIVFVKS